MIRINLLPFRAARKKEDIRRQVSYFLGTFALVILALIYYNISLNGKISSIKDNVAHTKNELKEYSKKTKEIAEIKKKLAILEKKTNVIKKLEQNRFEPVQLLDTMTIKVIAKRMWFTQFHSKENDVKISGIALDNKTIADFMTRLEGTGLFTSVKLNKIQRKIIKGQSLKMFQISCLKSTPQQPVKKKTTSRRAKRK